MMLDPKHLERVLSVLTVFASCLGVVVLSLVLGCQSIPEREQVTAYGRYAKQNIHGELCQITEYRGEPGAIAGRCKMLGMYKPYCTQFAKNLRWCNIFVPWEVDESWLKHEQKHCTHGDYHP